MCDNETFKYHFNCSDINAAVVVFINFYYDYLHICIGFVWIARQPDAAADAYSSHFASSLSSSLAAGEPALRTSPSRLQHLPPGISTAGENRTITAGENASRGRLSRQPAETAGQRSVDAQRKKSDDKCCIS